MYLRKRISRSKEDIFWFQIAVYYVLKVQVPQGNENLWMNTQREKTNEMHCCSELQGTSL